MSLESQEVQLQTQRLDDGSLLVGVRGEIDVATVQEFERGIKDLIDAGNHALLIDMRDVGFLGSEALSVLSDQHTHIHQHGSSFRVVANEHERRLLEITGLDEKLRVFGTMEDAMEAGR